MNLCPGFDERLPLRKRGAVIRVDIAVCAHGQPSQGVITPKWENKPAPKRVQI